MEHIECGNGLYVRNHIQFFWTHLVGRVQKMFRTLFKCFGLPKNEVNIKSHSGSVRL